MEETEQTNSDGEDVLKSYASIGDVKWIASEGYELYTEVVKRYSSIATATLHTCSS